MSLHVLHANVYAANRRKRGALRRARRTGADIISINEGYTSWSLWRALDRYRATRGEGGSDRRRGANSTYTLTRKAITSLGSGTMQWSEQAQPEKFAPERWAAYTLLDHQVGKVAHINFHANATARKRKPGSPIRCEYRESMVSLERTIRYFKAEGYAVIVTGDLNWPKRDDDRNWTPGAIFARNDMKVWARGVDYVAHTNDLTLARATVIPETETGSDHPWLLATFTR